MQKIRPITRNSRIGVAAPSSAALVPEHAKAGLDALYARGLEVVTWRELDGPPHGYLSGTDELRAAEFNDFLRCDDIDAIFCLRGGYGTLRILDLIDYKAAKQNPKLVVGYSDITALQLALLAKSGIPSLSGPMVAPDWPKLDAASEEHFWQVAGLTSPTQTRLPASEPLEVLKDGSAEGVLIGGNLTMLCSLLGTPYLPDLSGAILFLEDVGEAPYQIDRMLARLRLAGVLSQIGGLAFGAFTHADPRADRPSFSLNEVLRHYASFVSGPVVGGLAYGHFPNKVTIPIGLKASLDTTGTSALLSVTETLANHA